jgi:hypothetical protein
MCLKHTAHLFSNPDSLASLLLNFRYCFSCSNPQFVVEFRQECLLGLAGCITVAHLNRGRHIALYFTLNYVHTDIQLFKS